MGKINQTATVENAGDLHALREGYITADRVRRMEIQFLVDSGAAMICLPIDQINLLGLRPRNTRDVITAAGKMQRRVFDPIQIKIMDREGILEVMELPEGVPPLLGYLALESLDLYPNPAKQILEGNPKYDGKMVMDLL
jgi:predicted aspartyl protease